MFPYGMGKRSSSNHEDVNRTSLAKSLKMASKAGQIVNFRLEECQEPSTVTSYIFPRPTVNPKRCIVLVPDTALETGVLYDIIIPAGTILAEYGGPVKSDLVET